MALCTWQSHIPRRHFPRNISWGSRHCIRKKGALLGRGLRQVVTRARLESNISSMSRARVWTNSFTVAAHIQQGTCQRSADAQRRTFAFFWRRFYKEKPAAAPGRARQFAKRLLDTGDDELRRTARNIRSRFAEKLTLPKNLTAQTRRRKPKWVRKHHRPHSNDSSF